MSVRCLVWLHANQLFHLWFWKSLLVAAGRLCRARLHDICLPAAEWIEYLHSDHRNVCANWWRKQPEHQLGILQCAGNGAHLRSCLELKSKCSTPMDMYEYSMYEYLSSTQSNAYTITCVYTGGAVDVRSGYTNGRNHLFSTDSQVRLCSTRIYFDLYSYSYIYLLFKILNDCFE